LVFFFGWVGNSPVIRTPAYWAHQTPAEEVSESRK